MGILRAWRKKTWPIHELLQAVKPLFFRDLDLFVGFEEFVAHSYPKGKATYSNT
jgi:hypothetical protein